MSGQSYVRLRQICLAAKELAPARDALSDILGLVPFHSSPGVAKFGLENIVIPVNGSFLEIVAPLSDGDNRVTRFIDRTESRGGYMAIFDCSNPAALRKRLARNGVRIPYQNSVDGSDCIQLHPADMGATLLEFDHHAGKGDRFGYYQWGGDGWQAAIRTNDTVDLTGIEIRTPNPSGRAAQWAAIMDRDVTTATAGANPRIELDYGMISFIQAPAEERECLASATLTVTDIDRVLAKAASRGIAYDAASFTFCGLQFRLERHSPLNTGQSK